MNVFIFFYILLSRKNLDCSFLVYFCFRNFSFRIFWSEKKIVEKLCRGVSAPLNLREHLYFRFYTFSQLYSILTFCYRFQFFSSDYSGFSGMFPLEELKPPSSPYNFENGTKHYCLFYERSEYIFKF